MNKAKLFHLSYISRYFDKMNRRVLFFLTSYLLSSILYFKCFINLICHFPLESRRNKIGHEIQNCMKELQQSWATWQVVFHRISSREQKDEVSFIGDSRNESENSKYFITYGFESLVPSTLTTSQNKFLCNFQVLSFLIVYLSWFTA